jgi:hypothetical protein
MNRDEVESRQAVEWPLHEKLAYAGWILGAAYAGWLGYKLEFGWATLAVLPFGALFGAIVWMATMVVLLKVGQAIASRAPIWFAVLLQVALLPVVLVIAAFWFGGAGPDGPGRYGSP